MIGTGGASGGTLRGSMIPFPATKADREESGDGRRSIEERYDSKDQYLELVKQVTEDLISDRYLLNEDLDRIVDLSAQHYDHLAA